jgi:hypothetical protein
VIIVKYIKIINPQKIDILKKNKLNIPKVKTLNLTLGNKISLWRNTIVPTAANKKMSYSQLHKMYYINPFDDSDKDKVPNWRDCRPLDKNKHAIVPKGREKKIVHSFMGPETYEKIFNDAEKRIPDFYGKGTYREKEYSDELAYALEEREEQKHSAFKSIIGVHELNVPLPMGHTQLVHEYLKKYLDLKYPDCIFKFDINNPTIVNVIDHSMSDSLLNSTSYKMYQMPFNKLIPEQAAKVKDTAISAAKKGVVIEGRNVSTYLRDAPVYVTDLLKHLSPRYRKVKVLITDAPLDVLMKSTWPVDPMKATEKHPEGERPWSSCETLGREYEQGAFHDVALKNAVAYFYYNGTPGVDIPSGRVTLRWGEDEHSKVGIGIEKDVYPFSKKNETVGEGTALRQALQQYLQSKKHFVKSICTPYSYRGYSDTAGGGRPGEIEYNPYHIVDIGLEKDLHVFKQKIAKEKKIPASFMAHLVHETEPTIAIAMASREDLPEKYDLNYMEHPNYEIRSKIAKKPTITDTVFEKAFSDPEELVRVTLFNCQPKERINPKRLKSFIKKSDGEIYHGLASHVLLNTKTKVPTPALRTIFEKGDVYNLSDLAQRRDLPPSIIKDILESHNKTVIIHLIQHNIKKVPEKKLRDFIATRDLSLIHAIGENVHGLPMSVIRDLIKVKNIDMSIIHRILDIYDLPVAIQESIFKISQGNYGTLELLAQRKDLPYDIAIQLSNTKDSHILRCLLNNYDFFKRIFNVDKNKRDTLLINIINNFGDLSELPGRITTKVNLSKNIVKLLLDKCEEVRGTTWISEELAQNKTLSPECYNIIYTHANNPKYIKYGTIEALFLNNAIPNSLRKRIQQEHSAIASDLKEHFKHG